MPVSVKGGIELRKALRAYTPDLAKQMPKEIAAALKPVVKVARGYLPDNGSVLSGWRSRENYTGNFPLYDASIAKRSVGFKTTPSKPNRNGFRSLARLFNKRANDLKPLELALDGVVLYEMPDLTERESKSGNLPV